jgi:hypothetical protein
MAISTIKDKPDRRALIMTEIQSATQNDKVPYRGKLIDIPVIRIPIEIPIYRVRNGRIQVDQYQYISDKELPKDFFESGEENESVQNIQHSILLELSKDPKGNIYKELFEVAIQKDNLLITTDGIVVNGNRRLSAMRDLRAKEPNAYPEFSHIDVAVLPPEATEEDLERIETELQLTPETKLEYGWIQRRLKLRRQLEELKMDKGEIKRIYRFDREEDINTELQQLLLAEEYLSSFLKMPGAYKEVSNSEQMFKELQKAVKGKGGVEGDVRRLAGFLLVKEARLLGERAYSYRDLFGKDFIAVMNKFAIREGIQPYGNQIPTSAADEEEGDLFDDFLQPSASIFTPIKEFLSNPEKSKDTTEKLVNIYTDIKNDNKETDKRHKALKSVQDALRILSDVDLSVSDPKTHTQIRGQLESIIHTANVILRNLSSN